MVSFYFLFLIAFIFSILFLSQIGYILYKIYKKKENFRLHIILAIVFLVASVASSGFAVLSTAQKITSKDTNYSEILNDAGKNIGEITSSTVNGFLEGLTIDSTNKSQNNSDE